MILHFGATHLPKLQRQAASSPLGVCGLVNFMDTVDVYLELELQKLGTKFNDRLVSGVVGSGRLVAPLSGKYTGSALHTASGTAFRT
jgi:hypothetical protein